MHPYPHAPVDADTVAIAQMSYATNNARLLGCVLGAVVAAAPTDAAADVRLSDEWSVTRSAEVARTASIHRAPDAGSRVVGRLQKLTEDGYPEVYLLLRRTDDGRWTKVRIPRRPNGGTGWVPSGALVRADGGHGILPTGGHRISPVAVMRSPH